METPALHAENPDFVERSFVQTARATVQKVGWAGDVDVVYLNRGYDAGFVRGMQCEVTQNSELIGKILVVAVRPNQAAALILNIQPNSNIQPGQRAFSRPGMFRQNSSS